jgi:hypothetical protein
MTKIVWSVLIILTLLFCVAPCHSATLTLEQIEKYQKKMGFHQDDILAILRSITGSSEYEFGEDISNIIDKCEIRLLHIQSLLTIRSLIQNPSDRKRVKPIIDMVVKNVVSAMDSYVKQVNLNVSHIKNHGLINTATKFRDDLRDLKELLENSD